MRGGQRAKELAPKSGDNKVLLFLLQAIRLHGIIRRLRMRETSAGVGLWYNLCGEVPDGAMCASRLFAHEVHSLQLSLAGLANLAPFRQI